MSRLASESREAGRTGPGKAIRDKIVILSIQSCYERKRKASECFELPDPYVLIGAGDLKEGSHIIKGRYVGLVLLDLMLKETQGSETLLRFRRDFPDVPVVVVTDVDDKSLALDAIRNGAQDFVLKKDLTSRLLTRIIDFALTRHEYFDRAETASERERHLATHDKATDLPNRYLFRDHLTKALAQAERSDSKLAVLLMDLEGFKPLSDAYGKLAGDAVLRAVSERLLRSIRASDIVARFEGEEFVVVLSNVARREDVERWTEELKRQIQLPVDFEKRQLCVGLSMGVAMFPDDGRGAEELIGKADLGMFRSKMTGGEVVSFFSGAPVTGTEAAESSPAA
ncbi:MAG: diguanylate cyclase [Pseudomonadota bacterium]